MKMQRALGAVLSGAALLMTAACSPDLNVPNTNAPDVARATASPGDVQSLSLSAINDWYQSSTDIDPWVMLNVTGDLMTMNYGNFGARFNNLEPRIPYNNNVSSGDAEASANPWSNQYSTLGEADDVLRAIGAGVVLPGGTDKYKAIALWAQAGALMQLSLIFDKAFAVDEKFDPTVTPPVMIPYTDMETFAQGKLDALIALTSGKSETYDVTEFPLQGGLTSAKLNRIANTMAAQLLAYTPRTAAQAATVNWAKVLQYADKGIGTGSAGAPFDFSVIGDDIHWGSSLTDYFDFAGWMMIDMKLIHKMSPNVPDHFIGTPPGCASSDHACFDAYYAPQAPYDKRLGIDVSTAPSVSQNPGGYDFIYGRGVQGSASRGVYMQSPYYHLRYYKYSYQYSAESNIGPQPYTLAAENDLIKAEALIRTGGDRALAASLVNNTRVNRGGLTPLLATDNDATFLKAILYEQEVECVSTDGFGFFALRGMDELQTGTVRHMPVPAAELATDALPIYTFGGAVENPTGMNLAPSYVGARFNADLSRLQAGAQQRTLALPNGQSMTLTMPRAHRRLPSRLTATKF